MATQNHFEYNYPEFSMTASLEIMDAHSYFSLRDLNAQILHYKYYQK